MSDAQNVYATPSFLSDEDAAGFLIAYLTGWIGLVDRGGLLASETLVVLGAAGGSGSAAVQLGCALGARVIAVVNGARKAKFCTDLGAHHVVDRSTTSVSEAVMSLTDGRGADVVYDPVGGDLADDAQRAIAGGGRFLLVGFASGSWPALRPQDLVRRNYAAIGVYAGACTRPDRERMLERMSVLIESGALRPSVAVRSFDEVPAVLTEVAEAQVMGRLVVTQR